MTYYQKKSGYKQWAAINLNKSIKQKVIKFLKELITL